MEEKKFVKAEVEVIRFEKNDVIATSGEIGDQIGEGEEDLD